METFNQDQLKEIMQAAEEIESASSGSLNACGFNNNEERLAFINVQSADIIRRAAILLGYSKE